MGKAPAFQFYVKDWLSDPQLRMASFSTKGIWIDMLCFMWESETRGELFGTRCQIKKLVGVEEPDLELFLLEAKALGFCYIITDSNKNITLRNRRMYRDEKAKNNNRERQARYQAKLRSNEDITPPSSSSIASSSPKEEKRKRSFTSADVTFNDYFRSYAVKKGFDNGRSEELFERFKDYALANNKTYLDWDAAWRNWVNNEISFKGKPKKEAEKLW
jgi:hypothetical protein